jgi:4-hydroxymandelate oxidase
MTSTADSLAEYRLQAQQKLHPDVWRYLDDPGDHANTHALANIKLMPRPLRKLSGGHTHLTLFGQTFDHPILLAPVAYQKLFHPDGELASAMAAKAQGGQMLISSLASQLFSDIVACTKPDDAVPDTVPAPWFQLYWQTDRTQSLALLERASLAGCSAVVLTVDAPVKVASLDLPGGVHAVNLLPTRITAKPDNTVFGGLMARAPTWDDVAWLRRQTPLPLLLKGLLHQDDAVLAVDAGCDGVVVSNHGGRTLQAAPASIDCLATIVRRINGQVPVLFDSGIRSGQDVFAALAYGATAVLLGRPYVWALAAAGPMGVAHVIRLMRDELEMTMALTGCARLNDIGEHCLAQF